MVSGHEAVREIPEGERWLGLLGYEHLIGQETGHEFGGKPVLAQDFGVLCDKHARPIMAGLEVARETLGFDHPKYQEYLAAARESFEAYFPQTSDIAET